MKIAFVGKGGSGKTTISSLFCRYVSSQGLPVLAIDADINQHLGMALGLAAHDSSGLRPMGIEALRIKEFLRGQNPRIGAANEMIKTTPPGSGSRLVTVTENNELYDYFAKTIDGIRLMATGPFTEEDLGVKCYHSKVGAAELLLSHMIDRQEEYVVVDMTAGADSFASGMFAKFDLTVLVVEPTLKSLSVYDQYKQYADQFGVLVRVVANKVESEEDVDFIRQRVGGDLIAAFGASQFVKRMEKGMGAAITGLEPENTAVLAKIQTAADALVKDWGKFYRQTVEFHVKNAEAWANLEAGKDLALQVDPEFDLASAV